MTRICSECKQEIVEGEPYLPYRITAVKGTQNIHHTCYCLLVKKEKERKKMTLSSEDNQAWRDQLEVDGFGSVTALTKILQDLDARLKDVEDELWRINGYLKTTREE